MREFLKYAGAVIAIIGFVYFAEDRYVNVRELSAFETQTLSTFDEFRKSVKIDQLYSRLGYLQNLYIQAKISGDEGAIEAIKKEIEIVKGKIEELMYGE